jgi:HSP20 family protein
MLARFQREPWSLMNRWRCDIERAYHGLEDGLSPHGELTAAGWAPAVDLKEEDGAYVLYADLLGVDPKDIPLHMEDSALTLKRQRKSETTQGKDNYRRIERVTGSFHRRFTMPDTADAQNISAKSVNSVLQVRIPKQEKVLPRRIRVQS